MARLVPRLTLALRLPKPVCTSTHVRHINFFPSLPSNSSTPSPLATSSSTTLDDFDTWDSTDPLVVSLNYATDTELIDAILADPVPSSPQSPSISAVPARSRSRGRVSPSNLDWTSSVDPAFAFLALRQRPTFSRFIEHVRPQLDRVFESLRASGMHQLLASDIMLRNGEPRMLRDLLEVVAKSKATLRPSAVVSIYTAIRSRLADKTLQPLTGRANRAVSLALMSENDRVLLPEVFDFMHASLEWSPATAWSFLNIILYMTRHDHTDTALSMVKRLLEDARIRPMTMAQDETLHSQAKKLFIQSIIIRTCLENKLYGHVQQPVDELMETLENSNLTDATADLVLEIARVNIAGRIPEQVIWAGTILRRFAHLSNAPQIPTPIIDAFVMSTNRSSAIEFYLSLPESRNPPSPPHFIRLARSTTKPKVILELLRDVDKYSPPEFAAQRSAFIECLVQAQQPDAVIDLYTAWRQSLRLDFATMYSIVCYLTQGRHKRINSDFVNRVIEDYAGHTLPSTVNHLGLARAYRRVHDAEKAKEYLQRIDPTDRAFTAYMTNLIREHPIEAFRLIKLSDQVGLTTYSAFQSILDACVDGEWSTLDKAKHDEDTDGNTEQLLQTMGSIRRGRLGAAAKRIRELQREGVGVDIRASKMMIDRCVGYGRWQLAIETWLSVAKSQCSGDDRRLIRRTGRTILRRLSAVLRNAVTDIRPVVDMVSTGLYREFRNALNALLVDNHAEQDVLRQAMAKRETQWLLDDTQTLMRDVERLAELRRTIDQREKSRAYA